MASCPPPSSVQTKRFEEKRELILNAAALVFNERGVKGATFADVAGRVGLVPNSVTYYYRKKDDLALACFLRATANFETIAVQAAAAPDVAARVRAFLVGHAELLARIASRRSPEMILFNELHALPAPQREQIYAAYTDLFRKVRRLLRGAATEALTRDELTARAQLLVGVAHWLRLWIWRHEPGEYVRVGERVADIVLDGLASGGWRGLAGEDTWRLVDEVAGMGEAFLRAATQLVNEQGHKGASRAGWPPPRPPSRPPEGTWNGATQAVGFDNAAAFGYQAFTALVSSGGSASTIAFSFTNPQSFWLMDDVSISPVPEPGAGWMTGIGALWLALLRRGRASIKPTVARPG